MKGIHTKKREEDYIPNLLKTKNMGEVISDYTKEDGSRCPSSESMMAPFPANKDDIAEIWEVLEYQRLEIKDLRKKIKQIAKTIPYNYKALLKHRDKQNDKV